MNNPTLEKLVNRKERLEARVKLIKYRTMNQERKNDLRRKILAGAYILHKCEADNTLAVFIQELNKFLSKDVDKALFKLPFKSTPVGSAPAQTRAEAEPCN
ncbi:MAG TPA: mobilization protein [Gammaproteobacteria bacterium]|nr:mobilization protein [Gammaproteobacteria bacterium]